ncbi:Restriction endonuclease subunit S, partial [Dysosmobacter welbionis]
LQALPHLGGGLLTDDLPHRCGLVLTEDVALVVQHLFYQIGGVQIAAVDGGCLGPDQLQGRDVEGLSEGVGRQGNHVGVEAVLIGKDAFRLRRQVDTGGLHEAEGLQIAVVCLRADLQAHGDEGRVAGVAGSHLQGLGAVAGPLGAVDGLSPALHVDGAGAGEGGVHVHHALLQGRGQRDGLEGGAGLVGVLIALVPPLLELDGGPGIRQRLIVRLLRLVGAAVLLDLRQSGIQFRLKPLSIDGGKVSRIIVGIGGHGHNAAGVHVHDDAGAAVGRVVLIQHTLQALFQGVLDVGVQSQHQAAAILRIKHLLAAAEQQRRAVYVGRRDGQSSAAAEHVIIGRLQPVGAHIVGIDEPYHIACQRAEGIQPLGVRRQGDALEPGGPPAGRDENGVAVLVHRGKLVPLIVDLSVD